MTGKTIREGFRLSTSFALPINVISRPLSSGLSKDDYFHVLRMKRSFSLCLGELKTSYKKAIVEAHPDKHTHKSAEEQLAVTDLASLITQAYGVLKNDHSRALHLLELEGYPMKDNASGEILGNDILMEVMELRELIDRTTLKKDLQLLQEENRERIQDTCKNIGLAFEKNDLKEAKRITATLQYWNRIEESIVRNLSEENVLNG